MPTTSTPSNPSAARPSVMRNLAKALLALVGIGVIFAAAVVPIVLLAKRDHDAQKPLKDSLGADLVAIQDVAPMLAKGAATNPLTVRGKAIVLKATEKDSFDKNAKPTRWDMVMEVDELTFRLPKEVQATADDILQRRPVTVFVMHEWSTPLGTYGKGGPVAYDTQQKVWVVPWPDVAPAHLEEFHLLPAGSIRSSAFTGPDDNAARSQTPTDERGEARKWILKQVGAEK
jgi:hypothetical protein